MKINKLGKIIIWIVAFILYYLLLIFVGWFNCKLGFKCGIGLIPTTIAETFILFIYWGLIVKFIKYIS